jgi:hypothetical protein
MTPEADHGALAFAEKLLTLLDEGRITATYKYAVLLALMDVCLERATQKGEAPTLVSTRQLAEKVVELYWPHSVPYTGGAEARVLQQNRPSADRATGGQAAIVREIVAFRQRLGGDASAPLARARARNGASYERLVRTVEWKLVEMPLPRLQEVGGMQHRFIYVISWDASIKKRQFDDPSFDNGILLVGRAGDHLVRLAGLLRPLIQRHWAAAVARFNRGLIPDAQLDRFLFGADRVDLGPVRQPLRELQSDRCFYCHRRLRDDAQVDHFVPWSRYPNNDIENLVVADGRCNNAKHDHLAAVEHVSAWRQWTDERRADLEAIAAKALWDSARHRSLAVARAIYLRLPDDARLWRSPSEFATVDRSLLLQALASG